MDHYKQYRSHLGRSCGSEGTWPMGFDDDIKDLSGGDCDTLESSHFGKMNCSREVGGL